MFLRGRLNGTHSGVQMQPAREQDHQNIFSLKKATIALWALIVTRRQKTWNSFP